MNDAFKVNSIEYYGADNLGMSEIELKYISQLHVWHIHKGIYKATNSSWPDTVFWVSAWGYKRNRGICDAYMHH